MAGCCYHLKTVFIKPCSTPTSKKRTGFKQSISLIVDGFNTVSLYQYMLSSKIGVVRFTGFDLKTISSKNK
jgi:hypothetical protein